MPRRGLTTATVVKEAADLADTEGLQTVTLGRLSKRLGVRVPSLYKHIDGAADLFRQLAGMAISELADALRQATVGRSGRDSLSACCHAYRTFARQRPGRYAAIQYSAESPVASELCKAHEDVLSVGKAALRGYSLHEPETTLALRIVRCALHGFVSLEQTSGFRLELDADRTFERLIELLDTSLSHQLS
jgi:AcrR family transcriptional regulator